MDPLVVATFMLAAVTAVLAGFNIVLTLETRDLAKATRDLARSAQDQVQVSREELAHLREEAAVSQRPEIALELGSEEVEPITQREGMDLYYVWVDLRLANYCGHAIVDRIHVTGTPKVETRPLDVAGFISQGGRMPFRMRFDVGNAARSLEAKASVPVRARGVRQQEWRDWLFFVTVSFSLEQGGWRAEVGQPLDVAAARP